MTVTDIHDTDSSVSFRVSRTGVPVVVRTSYFPNWEASGADGPWRLTPNFMVVVPTSKTVTLRYARSGPEMHRHRAVDLRGRRRSVAWSSGGPAIPTTSEQSRIRPGRDGRRSAVRPIPVQNCRPVGRMRPIPAETPDEEPQVPGLLIVPPSPAVRILRPPIVADALDTIFKAYDVRGIYPDELDESVAKKIGNAFARFTAASTVIVGHDMRPSSIPLSQAFIEGATLAGADVVDVGPRLHRPGVLRVRAARRARRDVHRQPQPGPVQRHQDVPGLGGAGGRGDGSGADQGSGSGRAASSGPKRPGGSRPGTCSGNSPNHVRSFVDPSVLRPLRVVADTANGMGGLIVPAVFDGLPFEVEMLFADLDGTFPNHPADPIQPENLVSLQKAVLEAGADVGLAFDGDADRVFLVDNLAEPISGSTTTAIVPRRSSRRPGPGESVVYNLICSKAVPEIITEMGGTPIRSRVGHSFIKQVMAETGAVFGGEHSGHYYFRDNWRADSGIIAAMMVLEQLSRNDVPLSELRKPVERYAQSGEINTTVADPLAVIERVAEAYADARAGPARRAHGGHGGMVVQPPGEQHRAAPATER